MTNRLIYLQLAVLWQCKKAELFLLEPLFKGKDEIDHLYQIVDVLGTPPQSWNFGYFQAKRYGIIFPQKRKQDLSKIISNASKKAIDLLDKIFQYNHTQRVRAQSVLQHQFFKESNIIFLSNRLKGRSIDKNSFQYIPITQMEKQPYQSDISPKMQNQYRNKRKINPLSLSSNFQGISLRNKKSILNLNLTQKLLQKNNSFTEPNKNKLFAEKLERRNFPQQSNCFQKSKKKQKKKLGAFGFRTTDIKLEDFNINKNKFSLKQPKLKLDHLFD